MNNKWTIDKTFNFEMGHRVWAQKLAHAHLSISTDCACKHLHGHSYEIRVFLTSDFLDQSSMVTDFKNLNFMKKFVDDVLDHKFMLDINDPNFERITGVNSGIKNRIKDNDESKFVNFVNLKYALLSAGANWTPSDWEDQREYYESFVLVDFVPTSENICRYLKEYAQHQLGDVATVSALELWETKKSHCRYEG